MLNASNYLATETLPNGLRQLIRATEPHDDLAGAIQRKVSPTSFFYRFLRPKRYLRPLCALVLASLPDTASASGSLVSAAVDMRTQEEPRMKCRAMRFIIRSAIKSL
jgi:hypothetical protein